MSRFRSRWITAPVLFSFAAASCSDLPTASSRTAPSEARASASAARPAWAADSGGAPYICFTSVRTPQGPHRYRYGRVRLHFPASALALDGATTLYRYRVQSPGEDPVVVANCRIPWTVEAVEIMDRRLRVADRRRWRARDEQADGTATIQSCPGGVCILEPVYVSPYYPGGWGGGGGGGWDDGCGLNASVGDCWEDNGGNPYDPGYDGTYRPECERDAQGHCETREVSSDEWAEVARRVERIREDLDYCRGAKRVLRGLLAQGPGAQRIRFWEGIDMMGPNEQRFGQNLSDSAGRYIKYDSFWVWHDPSLIVHEGLHYWLNENAGDSGLVVRWDGLTNEQWVDTMDETCI